MVATYLIANHYSNPEMVVFSMAAVTIIMMVVNFSINHGISKAAQSKKSLEYANEKLGKAINKLKESEKAREDFIYMIIHDLRSPLNGIRMLSELLLGGKNKIKDKSGRESVRLVNHSTNHMLSLVNDLLDFSKLEAGKFRVKKVKQNIEATLEKIIGYYLPIADSKEISFVVNKAENIPEVDFDQRGIEQVLHNLLSNALKFTEKGVITVDILYHKKNKNLSNESSAAGLFWLTANKKLNILDNSIIIAVSDTGPGISKNLATRLFKKYSQDHEQQITSEKGTGLGLVICKGIVEAHGGLIDLETKEGEGTTFYFNLPVNKEE